MAGVKEEEEVSKNKRQRVDEACAYLENLPFDSVMEILPRLPLKSILRLQLASKSLFPLISDHLHRRYSLLNAVSGLFFSSPIYETPAKNFYHALDTKFVIDGTISSSADDLAIVDCCNGLLLCRWQKNNQGVIPLVCNPFPGQFAPIPYSSSSFANAVLAFNPCISGHYNILRFCIGNVEVFSSDTGSWVHKKQEDSHMARVGERLSFFSSMAKFTFQVMTLPL